MTTMTPAEEAIDKKINVLTDTALNVLRYLVQEPRAFVMIVKEQKSRTRYSVSKWGLSSAALMTREGTPVYAGYGRNRTFLPASLAAMPNKGLLVEIERPEVMPAANRVENSDYIETKFYQLTEAGKAMGNQLLDYVPDAPNLRFLLESAVQQAQWSMTSAATALAKAQLAVSTADAAYAKASKELAELGEETTLTPNQQALYDLCLSPLNIIGDILIEGTEENNAVLRRLAETQKGILHITSKSNVATVFDSEKRPMLILVENVEHVFPSYHGENLVARTKDGGRVICTTNNLPLVGAKKYGLRNPMTIKKEDACAH